MVLPAALRLLDPLVTDLRILNLVPFDNLVDDTWDHETAKQLKQYFMDKSMSNLGDYRICRVEMAVKNTIFAETFEIRQRIEGIDVDVVKYTLKNEMLSQELCLRNELVGEKLKSLVKRSGLYVPNKVAQALPKAIGPPKKPKEKAASQSFKKLSVGSNYQVYVKHFVSPKLFYIRLDDTNNMVGQKLMKKIETYDVRTPMKDISERRFCFVGLEGGKIQRGRITKNNEDGTFGVFLVDAADVVKSRCPKVERRWPCTGSRCATTHRDAKQAMHEHCRIVARSNSKTSMQRYAPLIDKERKY